MSSVLNRVKHRGGTRRSVELLTGQSVHHHMLESVRKTVLLEQDHSSTIQDGTTIYSIAIGSLVPKFGYRLNNIDFWSYRFPVLTLLKPKCMTTASQQTNFCDQSETYDL